VTQPVSNSSVHAPARADSGKRPLSIAMLSPGWPRSKYANGIVTGVECLRLAFRDIGVPIQVIAVEGRPEPGETDVHALPPPRPTSLFARPARWVAWRTAPYQTHRLEMADRIWRAIEPLIAAGKVDVLEMEESFGWASEVARRAPIPVAVTLNGPWFLHGPLFDGANATEMQLRIEAEGETLRNAFALIGPSRDVLQRSKQRYGLAARHEEVLPFPIGDHHGKGPWKLAGCDRNELLFVGRFDRHKGGDIAIDAFARVAARNARARLVFVGPDRGVTDPEGRRWTLKDYIEARIPGALASGRVVLTGQIDPRALAERYRNALATFTASRYENFSLAAMESLAFGTPTIVADQGGLPEHVLHGKTGLCFPAGNDAALAECMLELLDDPEYAARLGAAAFTHIAREFNPTQLARRRLAFFERVVEDFRSQRAS